MSGANGAAGNGQVPTGGQSGDQGQASGSQASNDQQGQVPSGQGANNNQSQQSQQPAGQQDAQSSDAGKSGLTLEQALDALDKARRDAAKQRVEAKELEALRKEKAERDQASMTAQEKAEKRANEAEAKLATERATYRQRIVRAEVRVQAAGVGIKPELAARLIDTSEIADDADDEAMATAIGKLLKQLAKENPELVRTQANGGNGGNGGQNGQQPSGQPSGTPNPGPTAPERQNGPVTVTANQYLDAKFRDEFKTRYGVSVQDAVLKGKAKVIG